MENVTQDDVKEAIATDLILGLSGVKDRLQGSKQTNSTNDNREDLILDEIMKRQGPYHQEHDG